MKKTVQGEKMAMDDKSHKGLSIGQLSRAFNLSNEAIRFYETKGLLHPRRDPENGYRTFGHADIQLIGLIKRMQNQGFSLSEITPTFAPHTQAEIQALFSEKLKSLEQQAKYQARLREFTGKVTRALSCPPAPPTLHEAEPIYYRAFESVAAFWRVALRNSLYATLLTHMPLTSFSTFVSGLPGSAHMRRGVMIGQADLELIGIATPDGFVFQPGGAALVATCFMEETKFGFDQLVKPFEAALLKEGLSPAGELYTRQVAGYIAPSGCFVHVVEAILPVK
ncbi:MAG: MerR family transcriptional regulator [Clostridia bacterium]